MTPPLPLPLPQTYHHPDPLRTLAPHLLPYLPLSLPLLRCLQHHRTSSFSAALDDDDDDDDKDPRGDERSTTAYTLATFPPSSLASAAAEGEGGAGAEKEGEHKEKQQGLFSALYLDRSRAPETEAWVFTSYEGRSGFDVGGGARLGKRRRRRQWREEGDDDCSDVDDGDVRTSGCRRKKEEEEEKKDLEEREQRRQTRAQLLALLAAGARITGFTHRGVVRRYDDSDGNAHGVETESQSHGRTSVPSGPQQQRQHCPVLVVGTLNECLLEILAGRDLDWLGLQKVLSRDVDYDQAFQARLGDIRSLRVMDKGENGVEGKQEELDGSREKLSKTRDGVICGVSSAYWKWIIEPKYSSSMPSPSTTTGSRPRSSLDGDTLPASFQLPAGYAFSPIKRNELSLVVSRTAIPRTENTLAKMGSVGVRLISREHTNSTTTTTITTTRVADREAAAHLIAWAFLGLDGSLTSLHVETEHRGRGIAKAVAGYLFAALARRPLEMGFRPLEGAGGMAHSDVAEDNVESAGVARGLGGRKGWRIRWVGVDLGRVEEVIEGTRGGLTS